MRWLATPGGTGPEGAEAAVAADDDGSQEEVAAHDDELVQPKMAHDDGSQAEVDDEPQAAVAAHDDGPQSEVAAHDDELSVENPPFQAKEAASAEQASSVLDDDLKANSAAFTKALESRERMTASFCWLP